MNDQEMTAKFNDSVENFELYQKALGAGFPWMHFFERIRSKVVALGYLPQEGAMIIGARYETSGDKVLSGLLAGMESVADPAHMATMMLPWEDADLGRWKQMLCCVSASMFDAGVIAAYTKGDREEFDPIVENGAASLFGDVGFLGLRDKSIGFIKYMTGEEGVKIMEVIGNAACVNLYWDKTNSEAVFKLSKRVREQYFRNASKAAYVAGAIFAEYIATATVENVL